MDRLVVQGYKISEYINIINNNINDFNDIVKYLDEEKQKLVWESDNYNILIEKYNKMIKDYLAYITKMNRLVDYLNKVDISYDNTITEIKNEYKKVENEVENG